MPEFLANFSNQITEYWGRFNRRQKIQIISIFAGGLIALVVLTLILSRPTFVVYGTDISTADMNTITQTLTDNNIRYEIDDNATTLSVESGQFQNVKLLLGAQGLLSSEGFTYIDAFNNSFTTTSDERDIKLQLAAENELNDTLELLASVESASIKFVLSDEKTYVFEEDKEASASLMIKPSGDMNSEQAYDIASWISSVVPNLSLENIKIMNTETSKLLFNGTTAGNAIGGVNSYMEIQSLAEEKYEQNLQMLLLSSTEFDDATVSANLQLDFDDVSVEEEKNTIPQDADGPLMTEIYIYSSTGTSTDGSGVPGTDSNDATTYVVDNAGGSDSTVDINESSGVVDRTVTRTVKAKGIILHDDSSMGVVLNKYQYYYEETLESEGALTDLTWEQFQQANNTKTAIEVDDQILAFITNTSKINDVSILAYEVPIFIDQEVVTNEVADYIPVIIIVLMIAMLGYAVYRGTEPVEVTEIEPELSVEEMLATTSKVSDELDAIEMNDKSEARVQIERFVDENPEAVAQLLRNWLNEDWE